MLAAACCVLAGLARPSLLGLPYVAAAIVGVWRWGRRRPTTPRRTVLLVGQVYAGVQLPDLLHIRQFLALSWVCTEVCLALKQVPMQTCEHRGLLASRCQGSAL